MLFALADLFSYRFRRNHYGDDPRRNIMALGHVKRIPDETFQMLEPGDIILCQRMNSLLSWAVMYFGGYGVDHVAVYVGDGKIIHTTFSGVMQHSIHVLSRGTRVLPFRLYGMDESDPGFAQTREPPKGSFLDRGTPGLRANGAKEDGSPNVVLPPVLQLTLVGIQIVLGLRPTSFKWRYYIDVGFLVALIDLILWPLNHFPMGITVWAVWLLNLIRLRRQYRKQLFAGQKFQPDSHPGLFMRMMWNQGGHIFPSQINNGRKKVRVWPQWAVPSSQRKTVPLSPSPLSTQESSTSDQ
jgi:hypothetical protein